MSNSAKGKKKKQVTFEGHIQGCQDELYPIVQVPDSIVSKLDHDGMLKKITVIVETL